MKINTQTMQPDLWATCMSLALVQRFHSAAQFLLILKKCNWLISNHLKNISPIITKKEINNLTPIIKRWTLNE